MKSGVVAVIRTDDPEIALTLARGFNATSVDAIEVTMTVPNALQVIEKLLAEGVTRLGGGTVRTIEQVQRLQSMGAAFGVAPNLDEAILKEAVRVGLPFTPGTLTPSEMVRAQQLGATSLKCMGGALWSQEIAMTHDVKAVYDYACASLERIANSAG